jgi:hypothetical protein
MVAKSEPGESEYPPKPLNYVYGQPPSDAEGEFFPNEDGVLLIEGLHIKPDIPTISEQKYVHEKYRERAESLLLNFVSTHAMGEFFNQRSKAMECAFICPLGSVMRMENWFKDALLGNLKTTELLQRLSPRILRVIDKLRNEKYRPAFHKGIMSEKDGLFKILKSLADLMKIQKELHNEDLTSLKRNRPLF